MQIEMLSLWSAKEALLPLLRQTVYQPTSPRLSPPTAAFLLLYSYILWGADKKKFCVTSEVTPYFIIKKVRARGDVSFLISWMILKSPFPLVKASSLQQVLNSQCIIYNSSTLQREMLWNIQLLHIQKKSCFHGEEETDKVILSLQTYSLIHTKLMNRINQMMSSEISPRFKMNKHNHFK